MHTSRLPSMVTISALQQRRPVDPTLPCFSGGKKLKDESQKLQFFEAFFLILNNALRFGAVALLGSVINLVGFLG